MRDLITVFVPVYFILFFGLGFVWRTWRTWKQTGINPYRIIHNPGPEIIISRYFRVLPLLSVLAGVAYLLGDTTYAYLAPFYWLEHAWLELLGMALMAAALVIIVVAQAQMGESWRIGVDHENRTEMVSHGLFRHSRNPIFVGIMLSVGGFFLLLPNAITLLVAMLDLLLVEVQVRLEEERLESLHGDAYREYCGRVRRWV